MGKEEYLKARMAKLEKTIKKRKAAVADYNTVQPPSPGPPSARTGKVRVVRTVL